ncbi:MAG: hypothetical protein JSW39_23965 [Desulfobacterales bacterium]|nr:MAG: hypothetical protein JSW39_23965 [Desulfobacterales bacterium]
MAAEIRPIHAVGAQGVALTESKPPPVSLRPADAMSIVNQAVDVFARSILAVCQSLAFAARHPPIAPGSFLHSLDLALFLEKLTGLIAGQRAALDSRMDSALLPHLAIAAMARPNLIRPGKTRGEHDNHENDDFLHGKILRACPFVSF